MGLIGDCGVSTPRSSNSDLVGDNGLSPFVDVNMPHDLLAGLVDPSERFDRRAALRLRLHRKRHVALHGIGVGAGVIEGPVHEVGEQSVKNVRL